MNLIAAMDAEGNIGFNNELLFSIGEDMAFFKAKTKGLGKVVIMGMKTFKSLPKPLEGRFNIVVSRTTPEGLYKYEYDKPEKLVRVEPTLPMGQYIQVINKVSSLHTILSSYNDKDVFVIGGSEIYGLLAPYCDTAYITKVNKVYRHANVKFPFNIFDYRHSWKVNEVTGPRNVRIHGEPIEYRFFTLIKSGEIKKLPESTNVGGVK